MLSIADPLRTPRLVLRAFRGTDLDDEHRFASDPEVVRYLPWEVRTRSEVLQWLRVRMAGERLEGDGDAVAKGRSAS